MTLSTAMAQIATAVDLIVYIDTIPTAVGRKRRFVSDIIEVGPVGENGQPDEPVEQGATQQIQQLVTEGGEILVQVLKDPLGTKGARLTTFITIPSRYLVYMPKGRGIGISARIEDEAERHRLREIDQRLRHRNDHRELSRIGDRQRAIQQYLADKAKRGDEDCGKRGRAQHVSPCQRRTDIALI